ncbi:MAG: YvcK family protein [Candidatus Liptonbacteria bacterium]|nr:YvcK family protein [Candidatus Liptonbacteria bacterium]
MTSRLKDNLCSKNNLELKNNQKKKVVVIGGGTGVFTVLTGLKKYGYKLSAIVSMADDGGSSGILREEFGILPPGDIRRALIALSNTDNKILSDLFNYRFKEGKGLKGHSFGNLFLTVLQRLTGSFQEAVKEAAKILNTKGEIIPVTLSSCRLFAKLENNQIIKGEKNIDIPKHNGLIKIKKVWLKPKVKANIEAIKAIQNADAIILGPGDLFTSIIPNLLVENIKKTIRKSPAKKIYICNLVTKFGETDAFKASDFLKTIEKYLGKNILDYFIVNVAKPKKSVFKRYRLEKSKIVEIDEKELLKTKKIKLIKADLLRENSSLLRHNPHKLSKLINQLI